MQDIVLKVQDCVRDVVGSPVEPTHSLYRDLGFDSLDAMSLIFNLEEAFGIHFDEAKFPIEADATVATVATIVASLLEPAA